MSRLTATPHATMFCSIPTTSQKASMYLNCATVYPSYRIASHGKEIPK